VRLSVEFIINEVEDGIRGNVKEFWKFVNKNRKNESCIPNLVTHEGKESSSLQESADFFADYFASTYCKHSPQRSFESEDLYGISVSQLYILMSVIFDRLRNPNIHKAAGPDSIPQWKHFIQKGGQKYFW
jgi:hypothetical protein